MSVTPERMGAAVTDCQLCARWPDGSGRWLAYDAIRKAGVEPYLVGCRWTHCMSCHSSEHNACEACGKCLGESNYRSDRMHCSNACRQRAYRNRRRAS